MAAAAAVTGPLRRHSQHQIRKLPWQKFTQHTGLVVPLDAANVDTDAIIPKQFFAEGYAPVLAPICLTTGVSSTKGPTAKSGIR